MTGDDRPSACRRATRPAAPRKNCDIVSMSLRDPGHERAPPLLGVVGDGSAGGCGRTARTRSPYSACSLRRAEPHDGRALGDGARSTMTTAPMTPSTVTSATSTPSLREAVVDRLLHEDRHDERPPAPTIASTDGERRRRGAARGWPRQPRRNVSSTPHSRRLGGHAQAAGGRARRPRPGGGRPGWRRSRSAWRPWATTRPSARYSTSSARAMVDGRLATMTVVTPDSSRAQAEEDQRLGGGVEARGGVVEQQHPGPATRARARAMRWRWPPDRVTPRSPTRVSTPSGSSSTNSSAWAASEGALDLVVGEVAAQVDVVAERLGRTGTAPGTRGCARPASTATEPDVGGQQAGDDLQERRLAGAGRADDGDRATGGDVEVDTGQDVTPAVEGVVDAAQRDAGGTGAAG